MAVPSGTVGNMTVSGHSFRIADFSIQFSQDVHDTTGFASGAPSTPASWRTSVAGLRVGMVTASGYFEDNADPNLIFAATNDQSGIAFTATVASGVTYTGTMILETASVGNSVNGVPVVSVTGRTTGEVTETTGSPT